MAYIAPAGTVMSLAEIVRGYGRGLAAERTEAELVAELSRRSGLPHCWPVSSGRAAMVLVLRAMQSAARDSQRDEVIIPAYTCYSVAASVARAGLKPRLCDVDPHTLAMDPDALERCDFSRALAIVSSNLYGVPNPLTQLERIARQRGVFMLDDAAQALGARCDGRAVGAFGDAGLYSFDKGKIICTIQGGAIVSRGAGLLASLQSVVESLDASSVGETLMNVVKLPVYALGLHPTLYGVIRQLPFLGLGKTQYETRYPISRLSSAQTGVAAVLTRRLDSLNEQRRLNAGRLAESLRDLPGIKLPSVAADSLPAYARFPLLVTRPERRDHIVGALDRAGIGASTSYPLSLADVPEVAAMLRSPQVDMPGAREVAKQIVTLPTHGYCPPDFGQRVRQLVTNALPVD